MQVGVTYMRIEDNLFSAIASEAEYSKKHGRKVIRDQ